MSLPNLLVIGAMKAGTYSLHNYLHAHPDVFMSQKRKEVNFFVEQMNWHRGIDWYEKFFDKRFVVRGESSTRYSMSHCFSGVPARALSVVPETKLIYLVRDPVKRLLSHYVHNVDDNLENRSFEDMLASPDRDEYVRTSCYWSQLQAWLEHFDPERVMVVCFEELVKNRSATMRPVFEFLDVDPDCPMDREAANHNSSDDKRRETGTGQLLRKLVGRRALRRNPWLRETFTSPIEPPQFCSQKYADIAALYAQETRSLEQFCKRRFSCWSNQTS